MDVTRLSVEDLRPEVLDEFDRSQQTRRVRFDDDGVFVERDDSFDDRWDRERKREIVSELVTCIEEGGVVVGARGDGGRLVGFANVLARRFGPSEEYVELPFLHVSAELRGHGLGRRLFTAAADGARLLGASKLYLAAHPAIATQAFYDSVGCVRARWIATDIYDKQPLDIQLEFGLEDD